MSTQIVGHLKKDYPRAQLEDSYFSVIPMKATVLFLLAVITSAASAQVYRCPDPQKGKTTYSDSPCTQGKQSDRPRTLEERMLDEERAAVARERFQLEQERQMMREQRQRPPQTVVIESGGSQPRATSYECEIAQKNAWGTNRAQAQRKADLACLGPEGAARVQAERERQRPVVTDCFRNGVHTRCVTR